MSFVRPELAARLVLWREPIGWAAVLAVGLVLMLRGYAAPATLGFVAGMLMAGVGFGLLRGALRRTRLRAAELAEGVVVIDEARIGFLGPRDGGFVDLPSINAVEIVTHGPDAHAWVLRADEGVRLTIPVGARGAEALYDALGALPGIDFDAAAAAMAGGRAAPSTIWRRDPVPPARRLH